ncbi:MAG: chemotaxis protein CheB [Kofleriaceae bacterium]
MIVEHHAPSRELLRSFFEYTGCEVVATATDPAYVLAIMEGLEVDVIVLDPESPRMNALDFIEDLMVERPTPVVLLASPTDVSARLAIRGLELGAVDIADKPHLDVRSRTCHHADALMAKVTAAARTKPRLPDEVGLRAPVESCVIAIGCGIGGTEALASILSDLPRETPGIAIVQHLPASVMHSFADRLDRESELCVRVARDGDRLKPGVALLAPGDLQMRVMRAGPRYRVRLTDDSAIHTRGSSIDAMFDSVAAASGNSSIGMLLAGNGTDGVRGLVAMHRAGAITVTQDEPSSVAFGMSRAAIAQGAAAYVLSPDRIAALLLELAC